MDSLRKNHANFGGDGQFPLRDSILRTSWYSRQDCYPQHGGTVWQLNVFLERFVVAIENGKFGQGSKYRPRACDADNHCSNTDALRMS